MKQQSWRIQHNNNTGYLVKSLRAIKKDEIVYNIISKPIKMKSISDLAKCTNFIGEILIQKRFYVSIDPYLVITSENELDNYKFFKHSDDPNCWLEELYIVARKDILPNEELSFDFSTLYGDDWSNLCNPSHSKTNWKEI
jgi:SET domain-containing protein